MGRPPKATRGEDGQAGPVDADSIEVDQELSEDSSRVGAEDDAAEFWHPGVIVRVIRISPEKWPHPVYGRDVITSGFLGDIPYGQNPEAYIQSTFGGGRYRVTRREPSKVNPGIYVFTATKTVQIPGPPLIHDENLERQRAAQATVPAPAADDPVGGADGAPLTFQGIPISGTDEQFIKQAQRMALVLHMIESAKPKSTDAALIDVLLKERAQQDPLAMVAKMADVWRALVELAPRSEGNGGMTSLLSDAIRALPQLIAAQKRQGVAPAPMPAPEQIAQLPNKPTQAAAESPAPAGGEDDMPGSESIANQAVETIVDAYLWETGRWSPEATAETLDTIVPHGVIRFLTPWADRFKRNALLALASRVEHITPEIEREFGAYFDTVFTVFTDPNRQVPGYTDANN